MPLPAIDQELGDEVDHLLADEPVNNTDLGACPWCSNCFENLTMKGGILCKLCYQAIYVSGLQMDWESCIERALLQGSVRVPDWTKGHDAIPRERDGSPLRECDTPECRCHVWYSGFYC